VIYGTASFVTGAFGLACAAAATRALIAAPSAP
jgi:tRNA A37 threonylcarbamoyladenosine dehydratase